MTDRGPELGHRHVDGHDPLVTIERRTTDAIGDGLEQLMVPLGDEGDSHLDDLGIVDRVVKVIAGTCTSKVDHHIEIE